MKKAHLQIGVGHFGIFRGRKWRESVLPVVRQFMRTHAVDASNANPRPKKEHDGAVA